jgi:hypothetical protein
VLGSEAKGNVEEGPTSHADAPQEFPPKALKHLEEGAPNISLHVPDANMLPWELWAFAIFGVSVQSAVLVLSGITIYRWHFQKSGAVVSGYAYPCFLTGTIALNAGLLICARTIQGSSKNLDFVLAKSRSRDASDADSRKNEMLHRAPYNIICIQRYAEKELESRAILNSDNDGFLRTSRSSGPQYEHMTELGSSLAVIGYLAQYLGSRGLP